MARVDLGQPGAPLPWAAPQLPPQSFTEVMQHILGSISPKENSNNFHNMQASSLIVASTSSSIHALHKTINSITIPKRDMLLHQFLKNDIHDEHTQLRTLISYVLLIGVLSSTSSSAAH